MKQNRLGLFAPIKSYRVTKTGANKRVDRSGGSLFHMVSFSVTPPPGHAGSLCVQSHGKYEK
jgi:hypothetical protein